MVTICVDDNNYNIVKTEVINKGLAPKVSPYCSFLPCGTYYTINGKNKLDYNENGCDINDLVFPFLKYSVVSGLASSTIISNSTGDFSFTLKSGNHTITPIIENPNYFTISPTNILVDYPSQNSPLNQNFCISIIPHHDVEVTFIPINPARPGFDAKYKIVYKNKGNIVENGTINLNFDDNALDLIYSNPTFFSQNVNTLTWNYSNLQPLETREIDLVFNVNNPTETPPVQIGYQLNYVATITLLITDEFQYDNTSAIKQIVIGSYDPNDKACIEGTTITPNMVGKYVHYMIRFENTGTFPAQNIVVKDMIDTTKFDINSLIPVKGSHSFVTRITETNKVEFIFENINLPFNDANNDGYVEPAEKVFLYFN